MSVGGLTRSEVPIDTRPTALIRGGLRRGALLVFLPVFAAGQAIAWLTYAASGLFQPWSWFKIGLAQTLASVRVPFETAGAEGASLQIAIGALTTVVLVLGFRAGREQARGLEGRPAAAARAGALIGLGFAIPMFAAAFPVTLDLPQFDIEGLRPVLWLAFAIPLAVGMATGAAGGLDAAHDRLEHGSTWTVRAVRKRARRRACVLVGNAVRLRRIPPGRRGVPRADRRLRAVRHRERRRRPGDGARACGARAEPVGARPVNRDGRHHDAVAGRPARRRGDAVGGEGGGTGRSVPHRVHGSGERSCLVPAVVRGLPVDPGRGHGSAVAGAPALAAAGCPSDSLRGALAGVVYAFFCAIAAWAATLVVPAVSRLTGASLRLGPSVAVTFALALVWGVVGGALGGSLAPRLVRQRASGPR